MERPAEKEGVVTVGMGVVQEVLVAAADAVMH